MWHGSAILVDRVPDLLATDARLLPLSAEYTPLDRPDLLDPRLMLVAACAIEHLLPVLCL